MDRPPMSYDLDEGAPSADGRSRGRAGIRGNLARVPNLLRRENLLGSVDAA